MNSPSHQLRSLIGVMRAAYARGENVMARARALSPDGSNAPLATLIAYDLQTGTYNELARERPELNTRWTEQLAQILAPFLTAGSSLLEAGAGEATTLAGVLRHLPVAPAQAFGFDLSWSRCQEGRAWLEERGGSAKLFVADLFEIPLADASIDVVYTSHTLEPNGGREDAALRELLRVTRRHLVLAEPAYEFADEAARERMRQHGYVRGLQEAAGRIGGRVVRHELLPFSINPRNPSGLLVIEKAGTASANAPAFQCPLTGTPLEDQGDVYFSAATGLAYPVMRGIPLLRADHAVVASKLPAAAPVS